ncbi:MAG: polysaccharide deacetylase family protein [Pirellulaceae bacterium]|nr:polysaccharide deacetylase family protein [Pirellulaceae bacterium]
MGSRRDFLSYSSLLAGSLASTLAGGIAGGIAGGSLMLQASAQDASQNAAQAPEKAQIAISLDLEMSRNFPAWEATHWDYEKGNLDEAAKQYSLAAAKRVAARGGRIHFFVVGRVLEQANVDWLKELHAAGHPLGNHTYDHVNVTASRLEDVQFRFSRAPWLASGHAPADVIRQNIRLCTSAMQQRLAIERPAGFRTPGGFANGLHDQPAVRADLLSQGYTWVSSLYPPHPNTEPGQRPDRKVIDGIIAAQAAAQPLRYADGLIELPMSPISDIGAFRTGRWKVEWFVDVVRESIEWCIEHRAAFDFLAHPSCLGVVDPEFKTIDMILDVVHKAGDRAELVTLDQLAQRRIK